MRTERRSVLRHLLDYAQSAKGPICLVMLAGLCAAQLHAAPPRRGWFPSRPSAPYQHQRHRPYRPHAPAYGPPVGVFLDMQGYGGQGYGAPAWRPSGSATFTIIPSPVLTVPQPHSTYPIPQNGVVIPGPPTAQEWQNPPIPILPAPQSAPVQQGTIDSGDVPLPPTGMQIDTFRKTGSGELTTPVAAEPDNAASHVGIRSGGSRRSPQLWSTTPAVPYGPRP